MIFQNLIKFQETVQCARPEVAVAKKGEFGEQLRSCRRILKKAWFDLFRSHIMAITLPADFWIADITKHAYINNNFASTFLTEKHFADKLRASKHGWNHKCQNGIRQ